MTISLKNFLCLSLLSFLIPVYLYADQTPGANEIFLPFPLEAPSTDLPTKDANNETVNQDGTDALNVKTNSPLLPGTSELKESESKKSVVSNFTETPKSKKKKKGKGDAIDPTEPPFKRGKALLTRNQKKSAESEFADSYSKEGANVTPSRTENANLFGLDAKDSEGSGLVEKIEDPDAKIKAQFELARSLDRMGVGESEEKAYKEYLKLLTSFPIHAEITPRTHLAIAVLLFRRQEYRPALHHLAKIMKEFKLAKEFPTAHYYAGRIYESAWVDRDLERAKKYYDLYLKESESKAETPGNDFKKDATERRHLIESPLGI